MKAAAAARLPTQQARVLELLRHGPQSTLDLHANYVLAVTNVIFRLRAAGHTIRTASMSNRVAVYTLVREAA